ncbi:MAG: hypothetical protein E7574_00790 [Ruminococcaceae bacterium]|nr:hypothetical protein [Oscillospiraceae bacterium]
MVLKPKESIISYRCPHCGTTVMSMVGTFALSGDLIKLKCSCGESELIISYTKDNKIKLSVPCLACENPHTFSINSSTFFEKELLELCCKVLGLPICFVGNKDKVFEAIEKADKELAEMMGEYSLEDIGRMSGRPEGSITDAQVSELVRFMLCEMKDENSIVCNCKDNEGEYDFSINENAVEIFCTKCNAKKTFNLSSVQKASDFLYIDELDLR